MEVAEHAAVVAVVAGQSALESAKEIRVRFPRHGDRIADDVAGEIEPRIDFLQCIEAEFDPLLHRLRQHLQRIAHPRVGEADDAGLVVAIVEQIGAARQPVGQCLAHQVAAGGRILVLPERPVGHHEGLGGLHIAGAVERHPQLGRKQVFLDLHVGGQNPALHRDEAGIEKFHVAPAVGDGDLLSRQALDAAGPGLGGAIMQLGQRRALRPMHQFFGRRIPKPARHLLDATHHDALVFVTVGGDDPQDFQHRVGKIRIPAAGAETNLAENLAVPEGFLPEGIGSRDEVIETAIIPNGNELVPDVFHLRRIALADRLAEIAEGRTLLQRLGPALLDFLEERRQLLGLLDIDGLAAKIDDRRVRCRIGQRVGKGFGRDAELVGIVIESSGRERKAHAAEFGDDATGPLEQLRAQAPADARRFVDDGLQAHLHQLIGGRHAGHARPNDGDLGAVLMGRNRTQAGGVFQPVIEGERKIRPIHGHWLRGIGFGNEEG